MLIIILFRFILAFLYKFISGVQKIVDILDVQILGLALRSLHKRRITFFHDAEVTNGADTRNVIL